MAANTRAASGMGMRGAGAGGVGSKKSYFEQQREVLIDEIAMTFEQVLANINKLNRSLEAVITVGNEFSSVEALWSQFEGVMGKEEEGEGGQGTGADATGEGADEQPEADEDEARRGGQDEEEESTYLEQHGTRRTGEDEEDV